MNGGYICVLYFLGNDILAVRTVKSTYSRNELGFGQYDIPVTLIDTPLSGQPSMSATSTLIIIVEDINDNPHSASSKTIEVYNYKGLYSDIYIGHVYVEDKDDWDRAEKTYEFVGDHIGFE